MIFFNAKVLPNMKKYFLLSLRGACFKAPKKLENRPLATVLKCPIRLAGYLPPLSPPELKHVGVLKAMGGQKAI